MLTDIIAGFHGQGGWLIMAATGLLMAFNPCMLAISPLAAGYVGRQSSSFLPKIIVSFFFLLGFAGMLAFLGFAAGSLGGILTFIKPFWSYVMAAIYLLMGGYLLRVHKHLPLKIYGFYQGRFMPKLPRLRGIWGASILGAVFGITPSPCITPVVAAVLAYVAPTAQPVYGASLLFFYGLGHGIPLFIGGALGATIAIGSIGEWFHRCFRPLVGWILIILGIYFLIWGQKLFL